MLLEVSCDLLALNSEDVEPDGLGKRSALADSDDVSCLNSAECWGAVGLEGGVSLLESLELSDVVQVVSSDGDGSMHLGGQDETLVDLSSDGWQTSEWALVVNVISLNGFLWSFET